MNCGVLGKRRFSGAGYLLDTFGGASFALSLRQLSSSATSAIRVRRSSDSTELDIGFSAGVLDSSALLTFCGAGSGYVKTIYDQSGNARHATQTTAAYQQRIVNAGALEVSGGLAAINGYTETTGYDTGFTGLTTKTIFAVSDTTQPLGQPTARVISSYLGSSGIGAECLFDATSSFMRFFDGGSVLSTIPIVNGQHIFYGNRVSGTSITASLDNGSEASTTSDSNANTLTYKVMEEGGPTTATRQEVPTYFQETVVYPTDQSANKAAIMANINNFYGIY